MNGPAPEARPSDGVLRNLVDVTSLMILQATSSHPRTVRDLAVELNLPIATLYRRVRSLQSVGAVFGHKVKDPATGKETMVYENAVSGVKISFDQATPVFEVALRDEGEDEDGMHASGGA